MCSERAWDARSCSTGASTGLRLRSRQSAMQSCPAAGAMPSPCLTMLMEAKQYSAPANRLTGTTPRIRRCLWSCSVGFTVSSSKVTLSPFSKSPSAFTYAWWSPACCPGRLAVVGEDSCIAHGQSKLAASDQTAGRRFNAAKLARCTQDPEKTITLALGRLPSSCSLTASRCRVNPTSALRAFALFPHYRIQEGERVIESVGCATCQLATHTLPPGHDY